MKQKIIYVSANWVKSVIDGKESGDYVILECSWGELTEESDYVKGHIKGAYHMNTDHIEREDTNWNIVSPKEIEEVLKKFGITKDTIVVCYGKSGVDAADDRVATALLWAGVENVKCLNGGLEQWMKAGYEQEQKINIPVKTENEFGIDIPAHPEIFMSIEEVQRKLEADDKFRLASVRSYEEYTGTQTGYDYVHLSAEPKGAVWVHNTDVGDYCKADGTMVDFDVVEKYLREAGITENNQIAFYCGTGWRASIPYLLCLENGRENVSIYDGGWFEWQKEDLREVQVGHPKSADCQYMTIGELKERGNV